MEVSGQRDVDGALPTGIQLVVPTGLQAVQNRDICCPCL
jgi:hypothetical protein